MTDIELLDSLSQYYFKFGIFTAEGQQEVNVDVINTDDTTTTIPMKIADIMYFTEYGTITIPGQHVFEKSTYYINYLLSEELSKLVDRILTNDITNETEIETILRALAIKVEQYIKSYMMSLIKKNNRLGSIINNKDSNKYIYNLNNLSKYVKCGLFRK